MLFPSRYFFRLSREKNFLHKCICSYNERCPQVPENKHLAPAAGADGRSLSKTALRVASRVFCFVAIVN